jgi:hypothetical protein
VSNLKLSPFFTIENPSLDIILISSCDITGFFFSFFLNRSGLTTANYSELSHIYEKYKPQGMLQKMEIVPRFIIIILKIFENWHLHSIEL